MNTSIASSSARHASPNNGRQLAVISVLLACVLFSTSATGRAYLDFPGSSISVGAWRVFLGGIGLAAYAAIRYGTSGLRKLIRMPIVWVMALAVLAYQISFFIGAARIGVAMGTGTDSAIGSADITLMRPGLMGVVGALKLATRTLKTIKVNLGWAFAYNVIGIPIAIAGALTPMYAAAAMAASSLVVVTNSLRIR